MNARTSHVIGWRIAETLTGHIPAVAFLAFKEMVIIVLKQRCLFSFICSIIENNSKTLNINECETGTAQCPEFSTCVNLPGAFFCNCTEGFQPLGIPLERCADIDECAQELHNCPENFKCQNEIGTFKCVKKCDAGYRLVNGTCVDVDECSERISECDKRASCVNLIGSYQCICEDGFTGDGGTCTPLNDCSQQEGICDRHAFCIGTLRMCICQSGYIGDGLNCYDVNECAAKQNPCESQTSATRCVNIDGGYICCEEDLDDKKCIREKGAFCSGGCGLHAVCYNETCQCMEGFHGDPRFKCSDINECENDKQCPGAGEWCVNMFGGFVCCNAESRNPECLIRNSKFDGVRRTFSTGSIQNKATGGFLIIDRQVISTEQFGLACYFGCPLDSHCVNGTCRCNDGFIGNTFEGCIDVNECELGLCNQSNSWCVNLRGSFACCTANSTLSDCIGLEIADRREQETDDNDGKQRVLSSGIDKIIIGKGDGASVSEATINTDKSNTGYEVWSDSPDESKISNNRRKNGWAIETVGEWRNFTGHAIIIGRGRIESRKWNVTRDKDGLLIGIGTQRNRTREEGYSVSSTKEERRETNREDGVVEGSGEGIGSGSVHGTGEASSSGAPGAGTSLLLKSNKTSEKASDGILTITTTPSPSTDTLDVEYKTREGTEKHGIVGFSTLKTSVYQTTTKATTSERGSESLVVPTSDLKFSASEALGVVSSEINFTRKFTSSIAPKTDTYSLSPKSAFKSELMKSIKIEPTTILETTKPKKTTQVVGSDSTESKELRDTTTDVKTNFGIITIDKKSWTVEEQFKTTTYSTDKNNERQMYRTDKEIHGSPPVLQNSVTTTESASLFSVSKSKAEWKKEQELQSGSTAEKNFGADVAINVKQDATAPLLIEAMRTTAIPGPDSSRLAGISHSTSGKTVKVHETHRSFKGLSHETTLNFGLEIAKVGPATDIQTGNELMEGSGEHDSGTSKIIGMHVTSYVSPKGTSSVPATDLTLVSQKSESKESVSRQKSVSVGAAETKTIYTTALGQRTEVSTNKEEELPTRSPSTSEVSSESVQATESAGISDITSYNSAVQTNSTRFPTSIQHSTALPNEVKLASFTKPTNHSGPSKSVETKLAIPSTAPIEARTHTLDESSKTSETYGLEISSTGSNRFTTSLASQEAIVSLPVRVAPADVKEEVIVKQLGKANHVLDLSKNAANKTENYEIKEITRGFKQTKVSEIKPAGETLILTKSVEMESSGEEPATELQNVSSGILVPTTNNLLGTVTAASDKTQEVGLEIVLMRGYPEVTELTDETSASLQSSWNNLSTTDVSDAPLPTAPARELRNQTLGPTDTPFAISSVAVDGDTRSDQGIVTMGKMREKGDSESSSTTEVTGFDKNIADERENLTPEITGTITKFEEAFTEYESPIKTSNALRVTSERVKTKSITEKSTTLESHATEESITPTSINTRDSVTTDDVTSDITTARNIEDTSGTNADRKQTFLEESFTGEDRKLITTISTSRNSEITSTSVSKPSESGFTLVRNAENLQTTNGISASDNQENRFRNALKPEDSDKTNVIQLGTRKVELATTPQAKRWSVISPLSSTEEVGIRTTGTGKHIAVTDEKNKYASDSTPRDFSISSESTKKISTVAVIGKESMILNVSENALKEQPSDIIKTTKETERTIASITPLFKVTEVRGISEVTKMSDEPKERTISSIVELSTSASRLITSDVTDIIGIGEKLKIKKPKDSDTSKSISETDHTALRITESGRTTSSGILEMSGTVISTVGESYAEVFSQSESKKVPEISQLGSTPATIAKEKVLRTELETRYASKSETTTDSLASASGAPVSVTKDEALESGKDGKSGLKSTTERVSTLETAVANTKGEESTSVQAAVSVKLKTVTQATSFPALETSTSPLSPAVEVITDHGSTVTLTDAKRFSSSFVVFGNKTDSKHSSKLFSEFVKFSTSTSASLVSETSLKDSMTRTTSGKNIIASQNFGSSKSDLEATSSSSSINVLKTVSEIPTSTMKSEQSKKNEIILGTETTVGLITEIESTSRMIVSPLEVSAEVAKAISENILIDTSEERTIRHGSEASSSISNDLIKISQQETVSPLHETLPNLSKDIQSKIATATKEEYSLNITTERLAVPNDIHIVSSRCRSSDECGLDAYCERRSGVCRCYPGFDGEPPMIACVDIDECERHLDDCDLTSRCTNKVGGFMCFCETGYRMSTEHVCVDIDECQERGGRPCNQYATCTNMPGSYQCQCNLGYTGDGYICIPMEKRHCTEEEMAKSNCERNHLCLVDNAGRIDCDTCKKGFLKETTGCTDINECSQGDVCHENAYCKNIMGSYSCHCQPGYEGDGFKCVDINECLNNPCHPQADCINYPGFYVCNCPSGWAGDGKNECINPSDTTCLVSFSGFFSAYVRKVVVAYSQSATACFTVTCKRKLNLFEYSGLHDGLKRQYSDIDECAENRYNCDPSNSICVNTDGGYKCECAPGYEGSGGVCIDVDECERGISGCNVAARCENHLGSVGCKCPSGFIGNGIHCTAIKPLRKVESGCNDEWRTICHTMNRTCHIDNEDVPQCGSCLIGHQPSHGKCLAIEEAGNCANPQKNDCDKNAECIDVHPGRHFCTCKIGYIGDGRRCDGPNCHLDVTMCHKNARCQLDGTCKCSSGYQGDGVTTCQLESGNKQDEIELDNRADTYKITKTSLVSKETRKIHVKESTTLPYDTVFASQFSSSPKEKSFTEGKVTERTHDALGSETSQQSSEIGYLDVTSKSGTLTRENSGEGSITIADNSKTSSGSVNKADRVAAFEGSGEDDSVDRNWLDGTELGHRLSTVKLPSSELASLHESTREAVTVRSSSSWIRPHFYSSLSFVSSSGTTKALHTDATSSISRKVTQAEPRQRCTVTNASSVCHELAVCLEQSGECVCKSGYHGDGYSICIKDTEDCNLDPTVCDLRAVCDVSTNTCKCIQGYIGDGIICAPDTFDCLLRPNLCSSSAECIGRRCVCNAGYTGDGTECVTAELLQDCTRCDARAKCYNETCICDKGYFGNGALCIADPGDCIHYPGLCHSNAVCDREKRRCKCTRGYTGNGMECKKRKDLLCLNEPSICDQNAECLPTGACYCKQGFEGDGYYCRKGPIYDILSFRDFEFFLMNVKFEEMRKTNQSVPSECKDQCTANEKCYQGKECRCANGYKRGANNSCMDVDECSMGLHDCHPVALCTNTIGSFMCTCPDSYYGDGRRCSQRHRLHNMSVDCELDGMTLILVNDPDLYDGRIFVRGQTDNPFCSKKLNALFTNESEYHLMIQYAHCNVRFEEPNTIAVTVVIQRHPMFITQRADAYDVRCTYPVGVRKVASHVGISEITTTKTIVETGIGPTCSLAVTNEYDQLIDTATVGQPLRLALTVHPNDTYAVLPRNCFAINLETGELYSLTDQAGCAIDTELFPEWIYRLPWFTTATFRTFKWPDSSMIRFQCDCSACIESCPKVNCSKRREAMKQSRFRHIREVPINSVDEELEKHIVKGTKWMAYSGSLHVNEEEELVRAQRDMKRWKYQGLKTYEEPMDALHDGICIRTFWIILFLLPLLSLLVFIGLLSATWRKKSSTKMRWRRAECLTGLYDNSSSYLKF
uniref:EGF-like domain-containing protein n=1 Tax=Setaria digitata TaxID=48799 RepID=A0A915PT69_9BILA